MSKRRSRGQLLKRSYGWLIRITAGYVDGRPDVRNYQFYDDSKRAAERELNRLLAEADQGVVLRPRKITLREWIKEWLETKVPSRDVDSRTVDGYRRKLELHVVPVIGSKQLAKINRADLQTVYAAMYDRGLSLRTVRGVHALMHNVLDEARLDGLVITNVAKEIKHKKPPAEMRRSLTPEEIRAVLAVFEGSRWYAYIFTLLNAGLRPSEALALTWANVDLRGRELRVQWTLAEKGRFKEPKSSASRRTLHITDELASVLKEHKVRQFRERKDYAAEHIGLGLVFPATHGGPQGLGNLTRRQWKPRLEQAGLDQTLTLYHIRHTCGTVLAQTCNARELAEYMGHEDPALSYRTYVHALPGRKQAAAESVSAFLETVVKPDKAELGGDAEGTGQ